MDRVRRIIEGVKARIKLELLLLEVNHSSKLYRLRRFFKKLKERLKG